jgi:hypothetical protein
MKTYCLISCFFALVLNSMGTTTRLLNSGPLVMKLMETAQKSDGVTTSKTNTTSNATTATTVTKSTTSTAFIETADLLALIENSFGVSLASDDKIVVNRAGSFYRLWVTDSTGTNTVMELGTNVFIGEAGEEAPIHAGTQTLISKTGKAGASGSGNVVETVKRLIVLNYDDTGLTTQDGTHTKFQVSFLVVRKTSQNLVTEQIKDTVKLDGVGNGMIRDQNVIVQGTGSATIKGVLMAPF